MSVAPVDSLISALDSLDVPCERTTPEGFAETIRARAGDHAVGVALDDVDVSLDGTGVDVDPTPAELKAAHTGVTPAEFAVADYGSVVVPSTPDGCELVSLFVDRHIAVLEESDVLPTMDAAFDRFGRSVREAGGSGIIATGPSATADMGELVLGAHGPSDVHVVVVEGTDE